MDAASDDVSTMDNLNTSDSGLHHTISMMYVGALCWILDCLAHSDVTIYV